MQSIIEDNDNYKFYQMDYDRIIKINAFWEIDFLQFVRNSKGDIQNEIESRGKEYILKVDETEFKSYLEEKYSLEPLEIDVSSCEIGEPTKGRTKSQGNFHSYTGDIYNFTITYRYSGSVEIFKIRPNPRLQNTYEITIYENKRIVSFSFDIDKTIPEIFENEKANYFKKAFGNLERANNNVKDWNFQVVNVVDTLFSAQKKKYIQENDFFAAINVRVNPNTISVFTAPTIKRKIIPQPSVPKNKEFSLVPTMAKEMYEDVLKVIYDSGKSMEKKPALYLDKYEEDLRDLFLYLLETRYDGITATGETFNRNGKTDILLKYANDGSNLFVAECKFWHGQAEFLDAISQLFNNYITWRDSKTALLIFVKNKDFTNVLKTIRTGIRNHPYFVKENGDRGDSSFSYLMRLPQDKDKHIFLEVIAFHYDKE